MGTVNETGWVLVVDDNRLAAKTLVRKFERRGYRAEAMYDGRAVLEALEAGRLDHDLVLLDVDMPDVNGLDVVRALRDRFSPTELPIVMLSANGADAQVVTALQLGANDYIVKPSDFMVVLARVRNQLAVQQAERALRVSQRRYALAVEATRDGLWDWDPASDRLYLSRRWHAMLGFEPGELGERLEDWLARVHPDDVDRLQQSITSLRDGHTERMSVEHRIERKDGSHVWVLCTGIAQRDDDGTAHRLAGSQTDLSSPRVHDPLTGLPNRRLFVDRLNRCMRRSQRRPQIFAAFFLDLDRFKRINDALGFEVGDQVLSVMAHRLTECLREEDSVGRPSDRGEPHTSSTLARFGGDEFSVLCEGLRSAADAARIARRMLVAFAEPVVVSGQTINATISIGVCVSNASYGSGEDLMRDAQTALHRAKSEGGGAYAMFDAAMHVDASRRLRLEAELAHAVRDEGLALLYQPIVSRRPGLIDRVEALVRWRHPERGLISPAEFIPLAEETLLINALGDWVLRAACTQAQSWIDQGLPPVQVAVNVSAHQFRRPDWVEVVRSTLAATGLAPEFLELELTESVCIGHEDEMLRRLVDLKRLGVRLAIDDFGTGYSSLSYLKQFPVDGLKIDRSFVAGLPESVPDRSICKTIVAMAHHLDMEVVAEGIESPAQLALLTEAGCDYLQGFFIGRPSTPERIEALLRGEREGWPEGLPSLGHGMRAA